MPPTASIAPTAPRRRGAEADYDPCRRRAAELGPRTPQAGLAGEGELLRRYASRRDPSAREELLIRYLPFARGLAMRYRGGSGGEPPEELTSVATVGLVAALERFDPDRGVPFPAFAAPTILGELRRHFRDRVWTLRVPRALQERIRKVEDAVARLQHELERSPSIAEVAAATDHDEDEVLEALEAATARSPLSIDQPRPGFGDEVAPALIDRVGGDDAGFAGAELRVAIEGAARGLDRIEREILRLSFVEDLTQSRIAERVGYSQMHVSRIRRRALDKLRAGIEDPAAA